MTTLPVNQTVVGDHNIIAGAGDIKVVYELPPLEKDDRRNLVILLERVEKFWIKDFFESAVQPVRLLLLNKQTIPNAVDHPLKMMPGAAEPVSHDIPPEKSISETFDDAGRLLLILGEPGSGKTTTLRQLTRELVKSARDNPNKPVPAVFHLSSWSEKRQPIFEWMVEELRTKYYIPRRLGRTFLKSNRLVPLLDGLDEVDVAHQSPCVEAINQFVRDVGAPGLVVCCRRTDYQRLSHRLALNDAVYLKPLSPQQVDNYLIEQGEGLVALRTLLLEDTNLQTLATSPLMLDVMVAAYSDVPLEALRDDRLNTPKARTDHIFQTYINRMFDSKAKNDAPDFREKMIYWTSLLAKNMSLHAQGIFLVERIQPSWLSSRRQLFAYLLGSRVAAGLMLGFVLGLPQLFTNDAPIAEAISYSGLVMLLMSMLGILAALLRLRRSKSIQPDVSQSGPSRSRVVLHVLAYMVVAGLLGAVIASIVGGIWLSWNLGSLNPGPDSTGLQQLWYSITPVPSALAGKEWAVFLILFAITCFLMGAFYGLMFGLFIGMKDIKRNFRDDIQTAEIVRWSGVRAKKGIKRVMLWVMIISSIAGVISFPFFLLYFSYLVIKHNATLSGLLMGSGASVAMSVIVLVVFILVLSLPFCAIGALFAGLHTSSHVETKHLTNQGIRNPFKNSIRAGIIVGVVLAVLDVVMKLINYPVNRLTGSTWGNEEIVVSDLLQNLVLMSLVLGLLAVIGYGGIDIIKHYVLRLILYLSGNGPRRFDTFLEHAVRLGFMHRVGGGYIFIHNLLRDYFEERLATQKQADTA